MSVGTCIRQYLLRHKARTACAVFLIASAVGAALLPPQLLRVIVDGILENGQEEQLLVFALLYTGSYLLVGLLGLCKEALLVCVSQGISKEIRISMLKHVNRLTYQNFTRYDSASLEAYFNNDVLAIDRLITSGVVSISIDLFKMIGILVSIFLFSRMFGLIVLAVLPLLAWLALVIRRRMFDAQIKARNLEGTVNHLVYENVENMEAVKLYDQGHSSRKYKRVLEEHFSAVQTSVFYDAIFPPIMEIIKDLIIAALLLLSGFRGNWLGMSVGAVVSTISLVTDLFTPVENLGMELQTIQKSMAGLSRINQFFALAEDGERTQQLAEPQEMLELRFEHVFFSYENGEEVISDFNFALRGTDKVTLQGRSGAGKSTLMKLAYGLLQPTAGRVTVNGVDTCLLSDESRAKLFGIVYQEPFFSGGTIYEELTMYRDISEEAVRQSLAQVGLQRIGDLHRKFLASDYSTGELSLLNIARVILTDCQILFLDEMNARIDPATAERIMDIMNRAAADKMVLSINHYGNLLDHSSVLKLG